MSHQTDLSLQSFIARQYRDELAQFRAALESVPAPAFSVTTLGHSPAWHLLHVSEWLRLVILGDHSATYAHLGWEDQDWRAPLLGTPPLHEHSGKSELLGHLDRIGDQVVNHLQRSTDADLGGTSFSPSAPSGVRPRLDALGMHVRHIAYHRGQLRLGLKEQQ